ncbi:MAG: hypothetical protein IPH11_05235 [Ignavibacteriales bacterium]|nr:hypothetical protein [Ignavibacteriales bacterium]
MKFNSKQKKTFVIGIMIIIAAVIVWAGFGGEIFTKTQVLVEKQDELFGTTYKEWKDQFILGLDYTVGFSGIVALVSALIIFFKRDKNIS